MPCPQDQTVLQMTERQGVEIDYCPTCRGVWLDRGELDKIIDRAAADVAPGPSPARTYQPPPAPSPNPGGYPGGGYPQYPRSPDSPDDLSYDRRGYEDNRGYDARHSGDPRYGKKRRRDSFLGDLFDF
jgi:Zn-finger nucleic acid-binding protein